jgi:transmembrane sensor
VADINPLGGARASDAAYWRARMDGDPTEADWLGFTVWLEARPANRRAFDELDLILGDMDEHKNTLAAHLADTAPTGSVGGNVVPLRRMTATRALAWATGLAAAAALLFVMLPGHAPRTTTYAWATKVGERQDVALEDGSVIHLNTDTVLTASFTAAARTIRMDKGEALFDVSVDPKRPFSVVAGDQRVEVIGTAFNVLRHDGSVTVTVSRGIVRASIGAEGIAQSPVKLTIGDQYSRREGQAEYQVGKVDPSATLAWREGRLFYDDAELSRVVSDLNRNFPLQIAVSDDAVRKLRFSGVLKIDDEMSMLHRLESFLPITMQAEDNRIVLKARSGE